MKIRNTTRAVANGSSKNKSGLFTVAACSLLAGSSMFAGLAGASAAVSPPPVGLGTALSYSVLGGTTVTNTGPTTLSNNLGVSPGSAVTGFPPGIFGGTLHAADAPALQAQSDLTTAYNDAAGRASTALVSGDLVGKTLVAGVYKSATTLDLSGTLTLDGQGDPSSVFIFQVGSALTTASASHVNLINGASACNVYWQVGSSATLGTASDFKGTIMSLSSISATTGTTVEGRVLARNGQVSLDTNVFTMPVCSAPVISHSPVATPSPVVAPVPVVAAPIPSSAASAPVVVPAASAPIASTPDTSATLVGAVGSTGNGAGTSTQTERLANTGVTPSTPLFALAGGLLFVLGTAMLLFRRFVHKSNQKH